MKTTAVLFFFATLAFVGCKKYEEGGRIGKAEKNLTGTTWKLDKYLRNGNDETSTVQISNLEENYSESGVYSRTYIEIDGELKSEAGLYSFSSDKKQLNISGVSSLDDFSPNHSTLSSSTYNIVKLEDDEFWYSYENGGDKHEFRFTGN